ncbi:response regulator [Roseateles amylovorans]|uniref:Response regulator transcription factor n=1 Tax=Roseateles amylovorans TaxID=2978473 RepID=A0ABY6B551_9BURK|nr:response regulator transcription factor [Roseateles amylovorans]UXH79433.1 response regulator transcription factor [Roseateles amylovorans]
MSLRIVLADDHRLVREGLRALLTREADVEVVGLAEDGAAAVRLVRQLEPDLLLTDVAMPGLNGLEAARRVKAQQPQVGVICLSMHGDQRTVVGALHAGASAFVLKDASSEELVQAVREVAAGRIFLSAGLMGAVVEELRSRQRLPSAPLREAEGPSLTAREREIVQLFAEDLSTQEIADRLHVSAKTVATHRENVTRKLGVRGVAGLTRYAVKEGLSTVEPVPHG